MGIISLSNRAITAVACGVMLVQLSYAQDDVGANEFTQNIRDENSKALEFSYGVPDSPALALSGLSSSDVTTVNQLRNFVVTLPKFDDSETAIGVDIKPLSLFGGNVRKIKTIDDYAAQSFPKRILARTGISLLAKNGVEDDDSSKSTKSLISLGFSSSLLDTSDPLLFKAENDPVCSSYFGKLAEFEDIEPTPEWLKQVEYDLLGIDNAVNSAMDFYKDNGISTYKLREILEAQISKAEQIQSALNTYLVESRIPENEGILVDKNIIEALKRAVGSISSAQSGNVDEIAQSNEFKLIVDQFVDGIAAVSQALLDNPRYIRREALTPAALVKVATACQAEIDKKLKRAANWDIGAAHIWRGATDEFSDFESGAYALWTSVRVPLFNKTGEKDSYWVLGGTARWGVDEIVSTGDETTPDGKAETVSVWGGLEYFSEKWRAGARYGWVETDYAESALDAFSSDGERWLINADYNIAPNIWFSATYGEADGTVDALQGEQLSVGLKFSSPTALNFFE